ncbi:hypothetical protein BOTCAL_0114g00190 [Botryotinia calthae]|uniref:Uncharacterized protein n=1 Tax=Botryotinia calthae TaxID=38488 RepID=A0A4Y8D7F6_9HELO|nr:hypothetical protein BOTCAL_0114g00190 [Botryotinia calthae]
MSGMNAVTTVAASLIIIIFVIVFMVYVPSYIGIRFERRRIAAQNNCRSMNWPSPAPQGQYQEPGKEYDIEMNDWPLRCPQPALVRRPSDWPLRRIESVVMSERKRESVKTVGSKSGSAGGNLEGFPYYVR